MQCPECSSRRVWKDGLRYTRHGQIQRFLCRDCGFRFSESTAQLQVKVNIPRQLRGASHSVDKLAPPPRGATNLALKEPFNEPSFSFRENILSHSTVTNTPAVGKGLY
ncbi:MAG: hypothetical protein ACE5Z5_13325, partial [Candidatus Bathyarchaeia archaeon]